MRLQTPRNLKLRDLFKINERAELKEADVRKHIRSTPSPIVRADIVSGRPIDKPVIFRLSRNEIVILQGKEIIEHHFKPTNATDRTLKVLEVVEISFKDRYR